jgi:hypothetical protein
MGAMLWAKLQAAALVTRGVGTKTYRTAIKDAMFEGAELTGTVMPDGTIHE